MASGVSVFSGRPSALRLGQEVLGQGRDVVHPLAQRRQAQRHDVEPIEQILAEQPLAHHQPQIAMAGGNDTDVGADRVVTADRHELALLQDAQQPGLRLERHVADLIEEQGAALGLLEPAHAARVGAGERALLVPEQLALDQFARDRRHVDGDERPALALAEIVQRLGDQLLAGAGLAGDQDGQVGIHQPRDDAVDLLHRRGATDDRQLFLRQVGLAWGRNSPLPADQGALHRRHQIADVERLGQIFESAALGRPDSGEQRVLCAHHDHRQAWSQGADAWQKVQRVLVRQGNVGDHDVALPGGYPAPEGCGDTRRLNLVALPRQSSADDRADGAVILRQEHLLAAHATSRRKSGSWCRRAAGRRTLKVEPGSPGR